MFNDKNIFWHKMSIERYQSQKMQKVLHGPDKNPSAGFQHGCNLNGKGKNSQRVYPAGTGNDEQKRQLFLIKKSKGDQKNKAAQTEASVSPKGKLLRKGIGKAKQHSGKQKQNKKRFEKAVFSVTAAIYGKQVEKKQFQSRQILNDRHLIYPSPVIPGSCRPYRRPSG